MEKKIVVFFIVVLLAGLIGGYGLSYVVYDLQTQNLKRDLDRLNDRLDAINSTLLNTLNDLQSEVSNLTSQVTDLNSTIQGKFDDLNTTISNINSLLLRINSTLLTILDKLFPIFEFEKLEFTTAYATVNVTDFTVHLKVKNTGSATATIDIPAILYNGIPADGYTAKPVAVFNQTTLNPGQSATGTVVLPRTSAEWVSGMTVEIMIQTTADKDYPKVVILP